MELSNSTSRTNSRAFVVLPILTLTRRELVRFFRQRTRVIGALGQPFLFWILFGAGLHGSFTAPEWAPAGMSYQEYFFPGIAVLILMFSAIFSTISIIEDRREGFLQGVLVAPVGRLPLVLGKLCGGTLLALIQAVAFLVIGPMLSWIGLAPEMSLQIGFGDALLTLCFLALVGFALTGLGYLIAWPMDSTQGFHAIMSIFLLPMWLLSGAFFPGNGWLGWVVRLNPLSYGVAGVRRLMYPNQIVDGADTLPSMMTCLIVTTAFSCICVSIAVWMTGRRTSKDAR
ncbi:MAG: ABC transporter [Planctomycetaceae bacterium]|nr:ABC transporter [Planctomycetaceae bacterium]